MSDIVERLRYAATSRPGGICEEAADEIERLRETVKNLRESAKLRVQYHAAELADVAAERDVARDEIARLKEARIQFSHADAAEIERLRAQVAALEGDAGRYRWLRAGNYNFAVARSILNDTPWGIDASIDRQLAARKGEA